MPPQYQATKMIKLGPHDRSLDTVITLLHLLHPETPYYIGSLIVRVDGKVVSGPSHYSGNAACGFCRKGIVSWRANAKRRGTSGETMSMLHNVSRGEHVYTCAETWLLRTLCAYSTETMPEDHRKRVARWRRDNLSTDGDDPRYRRCPSSLRGVFDTLPVPVAHERTVQVEVLLGLHERIVRLALTAGE